MHFFFGRGRILLPIQYCTIILKKKQDYTTFFLNIWLRAYTNLNILICHLHVCGRKTWKYDGYGIFPDKKKGMNASWRNKLLNVQTLFHNKHDWCTEQTEKATCTSMLSKGHQLEKVAEIEFGLGTTVLIGLVIVPVIK